jgi:hypothetical protein
MATRRVSWRRTDEIETDEHATLTIRDTGLSLVGTVIGADGGVPLRVEYRILTDGNGMTTAAHIRDMRGFEQRALTLERNAKGTWSVNGAAVGDVGELAPEQHHQDGRADEAEPERGGDVERARQDAADGAPMTSPPTIATR